MVWRCDALVFWKERNVEPKKVKPDPALKDNVRSVHVERCESFENDGDISLLEKSGVEVRQGNTMMKLIHKSTNTNHDPSCLHDLQRMTPQLSLEE